MPPDLPLDRGALAAVMAAGFAPDWLLFWGHHPAADGRVTASCLSQWWPAPFEVNGLTYPTAEHYMMAAKARLFGDGATAARILEAPSPKEAKALGRGVAGFEEGPWAAARFGIVVAANLAKFSRHPDLGTFLLGTGNRVLVEASPVDRVWGIGLAADDARARQPHLWPGLNLLGFALMAVRSRLAGA